MAAQKKHTIVIVGCGIAGPTLALTILKHPQLSAQYTPILLDRLPEASAYFGGAAVILASNAIYPLLQLGLKEALWGSSAEAISTTLWRSTSPSTAPARRTNSLNNPNWTPELSTGLRVIERSTLMKLLVDEVLALGGVVHWNSKVTEVKQTAGGVDITLSTGVVIPADLVVGADGGWSMVRKHICPSDWKPEFMAASVIYGISRRPAGTDEEVLGMGHAVLLDVGGVSTWALPGGRQFWCVSVPESTPPTGRSETVESKTYGPVTTGGYSLESTEEVLVRFEKTWYPGVGECGAFFRDSEIIVRTGLWQRVFGENECVDAAGGNVVLVGDAGRIMVPTSGQGACLAIEDATVLADALLNNPPTWTTSVGGSKWDFGTALREYTSARVPRSRSIARQAYWSGIAFMAERWWWRWLRDFFVAWVPMEQDPKGKMERGEKVKDLVEWLHGVRYEVKLREKGEGEGGVTQG